MFSVVRYILIYGFNVVRLVKCFQAMFGTANPASTDVFLFVVNSITLIVSRKAYTVLSVYFIKICTNVRINKET